MRPYYNAHTSPCTTGTVMESQADSEMWQDIASGDTSLLDAFIPSKYEVVLYIYPEPVFGDELYCSNYEFITQIEEI